MAAEIDATIFAALSDRLSALTISPAMPIAWPNVAFPAPNQSTPTAYLRVDFLPNRNIPYPMGDDPEPHQGIFQVSVFRAKGEGMTKSLNVAGAIIDHFKNQKISVEDMIIKISSEPWAANPIQEDTRVQVPVTIPYIAFPPEN